LISFFRKRRRQACCIAANQGLGRYHKTERGKQRMADAGSVREGSNEKEKK
jgi:hypothetical protein